MLRDSEKASLALVDARIVIITSSVRSLSWANLRLKASFKSLGLVDPGLNPNVRLENPVSGDLVHDTPSQSPVLADIDVVALGSHGDALQPAESSEFARA